MRVIDQTLRAEPRLWSRAQFGMVLERIVKALHHAVVMSELVAELKYARGWYPWDKHADDKAMLLSLINYNFLALQFPSEFARDLPQEVYGTKQRETVVTLPLPGHVLAAKRVLKG